MMRKVWIFHVWTHELSIIRGRNKYRYKYKFIVSRLSTSCRRIGRAHLLKADAGVYDGTIEFDSHADTFVAGRNCTLLH